MKTTFNLTDKQIEILFNNMCFERLKETFKKNLDEINKEEPLKTLKDLQKPSDMLRLSLPPQEVYGVSIDKLKQEVIKHLEFQKENIKKYSKKGMEMDVYATDVLRKWIAKFFNIDVGFSI